MNNLGNVVVSFDVETGHAIVSAYYRNKLVDECQVDKDVNISAVTQRLLWNVTDRTKEFRQLILLYDSVLWKTSEALEDLDYAKTFF